MLPNCFPLFTTSVQKTVRLLSALVCGASLANADVLGEWTFDSGASSAELRASTNLSAGVTSLSALEFNTFDDVGPGSVPSSEHDGIGFGGNEGENVAFIHRANYFDGSAVPPKETASDFTSFGGGASQGTSAGQGDGHATISFTVSAGVEPLQIESITVDQIHQTSASLIVGFQEADTAAGATVTLNVTNNGLGTAYLTTPVVIGAGQTKTFTISLNSGVLNSIHNVNSIQLNGAIAPEYVRSALLGQWTFNDGANSGERLQSSGAATGVTLSSLALHPEVTDFGYGGVPSGDDDGAGYGGNSGEHVLFWHRANYTNDTAPVDKVTTWGVPGVDTGIDTTVANAPMSFTLTAGATQTITVERLLIISSNGTGGCRAHFQEAGQTAGGAHSGWGDSLVPLNEPVVIAPGTTKTFTINWSGDELDIKQNIDHIDLHGSIRTGGAQETVRTLYSQATGTATPPQGWALKWNAPTGWVAGVEPGDLSSGAITDTNSWTAMQWGGGVWSADGNSNGADSSPDNFIRILGLGGHPGEAGASRDLDRYTIAVFTVDAAGDYQLGQGWIEKASPSGNGLLVKIFSQGQLVKTVKCAAGSMAQFEARMEGLSVGDEIAVAVGSAGDSAHDSFEMDFEIARVDPSFAGLPVFEVAAYGALGDGSTDDFDAIQAAVDAALAAGGGIVRFDGTKTYRIIGNETGDNDVERVFDLEGAFNIKIEGNGAELVLHAPDSLAYITYCENIQMDGFTVRFDPLPYYQGTIDAIDVANLTMDITVPARYPEPEVGTDTVPQSHPFFARSFIPEAPGARAGSGYHLYIDSTETIGGDPRKIRLNFTNGFTNNEGESSNMTDNLQATLDEGATEMVVPHVRYGHRGHHNIVVSHSSRVKLSNILYRNTPFFLCAPVSNLGPVTIANFDVLTADPANELFVTWRDGFHVKDNAYGLTIEDGDWHGGAMNDDLFNFAHMMKQVTAVSGSELSLVAAASFGGQHIWHAGDWISVWDPTQTILRGRARIVGPGSAATWAATLTLDREIAATVDDWVVNDSRSNRGMLVRDCTNHRLGTRSGSARFRTPAVRFENDHFDGVYFHLHSTTVHEGPVPRDYHFEDTYFKGSMSSLAEPIAVTAGEDIVFKNCTVDEGAIMGRDGSDLSLDGVDWINQSADVLDLRDNTVGYVYNQSTRNASEVLLADVSLDSSSLVFFEEARFLQGLSPTTGVFPFANLLAIFNDPIQVGSGDIIVRNLTDGIDTRIQITDTSQVSVIGRELRIDPVADLIAGKDYAVLIEAGALLDENGVALDGFSSESTWTFTVLDPATANIVLNGDFSDNALEFLDEWPGYVGFGGNAMSVSEWSYSNAGTGNKGINGDGIHTPFSPSDRSAVTYFAFLQHGSSQFSQDLTGRLAPNSRYRISFKAANRNGDSSALGQVAVGDDSTTFYDSSVQSWSTAAFQSVTAEFTTGASFDGSVQVTLRNATDESVGGVTVNYSDVEIVKIDSYAVWVETYPSLDLSDPNGDLEPDGIPHHMEFALGGHPNVDDADTIMPTHHSDGKSLNFIFRRADLAIGSDHEPYTAYSLNLLDWYPVTHGANGMTLSVNDDGAATGVDEVTVEVDYEQADQERMFLRLVVP